VYISVLFKNCAIYSLKVIEGVHEVIVTHISSTIKHQNNGPGLKINDIAKQLQWLQSRGKKCKPEVGVYG
jgi:hypothetical protein